MENQNMPADLVMEILSRASLQTVARCRLVSKEWKDLTQRALVISGFFIEFTNWSKYRSEFVSPKFPSDLSLRFLPGRVRILASTNQGLLFCENTELKCYKIPEFYVCKPTTKEWQQIPNPDTRYYGKSFGMVLLNRNPLHYKIIRLSEPNHMYGFCNDIFDSETWEWKQLKEIYLPVGEFLSVYRPTTVSSSSILHWLTSKKNILSFHAEEETWRTLSIPDALKNETFNLQLTQYEDKLGLICQEYKIEDCFDLWVMKDFSQEKLWEKKETVSVEPLLRVDRYPKPKAFHNEETALIICYHKIYFYTFSDGSFHGVELKNNFVGPPIIFPFQSNLELCNFTNSRLI